MYRLIGDTHQLDGVPHAIQEFLRAFDSVRKRLAIEAGVSGNELRALSRIAEAGSLTPKALAEYLEMSTPAVSALTNQLVLNALVVRVPHPTDRRSLLLELTPAGHQVMAAMYLDFQKSITDASRILDESRCQEFESALHAVADQLAGGPSSDGLLAARARP